MKTSVTVVIPAYNVSSYLESCVLSALYQSAAEVSEVLVVDNNSNDGTLGVALKLEERFKTKLRVMTEDRQGAHYARNAGLRAAAGDWIQFLDADDILLPQKIENQLRLIRASSRMNCMVWGSFVRFLENGTSAACQVKELNPFISLFWSHGACGITSSNLWRKDELLKVGGFSPVYSSSQETNLMFEILKLNDHVLYDKSLNTVVRHRVGGEHVSDENSSNVLVNFFELRKRILEHLINAKSNCIKVGDELSQIIYKSLVAKLLDSKVPVTDEYRAEVLSYLISNFYRPSYQSTETSAMERLKLERSTV